MRRRRNSSKLSTMDINVDCQCGSVLHIEATGDELVNVVGVLRAFYDAHKH